MRCSIVYDDMSCDEKEGTFSTLELIEKNEVDAVFGGICSTGRPHAHTETNSWQDFDISRLPNLRINSMNGHI